MPASDKGTSARKLDTRDALRQALGALAPEKIAQEAFEQDDGHLQRLVNLRPDERAQPHDLFAYMEDLHYTEIQSSLLLYLLPICLEVWRNDLRGVDTGYGGTVENFYPVLANQEVFTSHLTYEQTTVVSEFMRQTILAQVDDQCGLSYKGAKARPYRWISALTTYGVLLPDMELLWNEWWSLNTLGRAVAAVQYISCLMYAKNENPVFAPWTPDKGGGPPCLWEFEGHLYTNRWLEPNVAFLRRALNAQAVEDLLNRSAALLIEQPEHEIAARVLADFPLCTATVKARCAELPKILETTQDPGFDWEWP